MVELDFPPRLQLAQLPTPLQLLPRVSESLGVRVWMKRDDLTGSVLSGNKVRKLEFSLAEARNRGCDAIVTCGGVQSNHCRATALLGAQLGLKVALVLREESRGESSVPSDGNLLLGRLAGAEIDLHPARGFASELPDRLAAVAEDLRCRGYNPFVIPTGASDGTGIWGYIAAAQELAADFCRQRIVPSHIVCATGSGGTQAGLTLGAHWQGWSATVVGMAVCDDEAWFQRKVRADMHDWRQTYADRPGVGDFPLDSCRVVVNDRYKGPGYGEADPEVFATIAWLARTEGVVLDPVYTGKAFHGLLQELQAGRWSDARDLVFVHTGGVFGNFPQRQGFEPLWQAQAGQAGDIRSANQERQGNE